MVPVSEIAEIADKLTRNEIATSNEIRQEIGWKPSKDPVADELRNKNLNPSGTTSTTTTGEAEAVDTSAQDAIVDELFNSLEAEIDKIIENYMPDDEEEEES